MLILYFFTPCCSFLIVVLLTYWTLKHFASAVVNLIDYATKKMLSLSKPTINKERKTKIYCTFLCFSWKRNLPNVHAKPFQGAIVTYFQYIFSLIWWITATWFSFCRTNGVVWFHEWKATWQKLLINCPELSWSIMWLSKCCQWEESAWINYGLIFSRKIRGCHE